MKTIYYIFGALLAVTICFLIYFLFSAKANTISIQTTNGTLSVDNVQKTPNAKQLSSQDTLVQSNPDYDIVYFNLNAKDRSFLISIKSNALEIARAKAEDSFLQLLDITKDQACLLNVSLRVSKDVNEKLAGQEFGLSFCPNGKAFPN